MALLRPGPGAGAAGLFGSLPAPGGACTLRRVGGPRAGLGGSAGGRTLAAVSTGPATTLHWRRLARGSKWVPAALGPPCCSRLHPCPSPSVWPGRKPSARRHVSARSSTSSSSSSSGGSSGRGASKAHPGSSTVPSAVATTSAPPRTQPAQPPRPSQPPQLPKNRRTGADVSWPSDTKPAAADRGTPPRPRGQSLPTAGSTDSTETLGQSNSGTGQGVGQSTRQETAARERGRTLSSGDSTLQKRQALPLPMTTPKATPLSKEEVEEALNCDPDIQNCKEPVYQWVGECSACQGTGFAQPRSSSSSSSSRRRRRGKSSWGSSSSSWGQGFKCISCCGIGAVYHYTVRDDIPVMEDLDRKSL